MHMFGHLGLTIMVLRGLRRKTQAQVAREAGIGKSQLSKYENGKELPKLDSLAKILTVLDVTPLGLFYLQDLLDRRGKAVDGGRASGEINISPDDLSLLSSRTQQRMRALIDAVLSFQEALLQEKLDSTLAAGAGAKGSPRQPEPTLGEAKGEDPEALRQPRVREQRGRSRPR
jgi:transcriptional regulator with XRE-family HTH domain